MAGKGKGFRLFSNLIMVILTVGCIDAVYFVNYVIHYK